MPRQKYVKSFNVPPGAASRRRVVARKRSAGSRMSRYSISRSLVSPFKVYSFVRYSEQQFGYNNFNGLTSPNGSTVYGNGFGIKFNLSSGAVGQGNVTNLGSLGTMPNYQDFTNLFDDYRISAVTITMYYSNNVMTGTAAAGSYTGQALPMIAMCFDEDDYAAPTSTSVLDQRPETKTILLDTNGPKSITVRPKCQGYAESNGVSTQAPVLANSMWQNCSSPSIDYFGVKMWLNAWGTGATNLQCGYIQMKFTFVLDFRGVS